MMRRVALRREAVEPEHAVADDVDVLLRHRRELAPEHVERFAVQPPRALLQPRRVDEMRRADRRHVHLEPRMLADERAGRARVVEMDVAEQQVAHVGEREPGFGEPGLSASTVVLGPQSKSAGPSSVSRRYARDRLLVPEMARSIGSGADTP